MHVFNELRQSALSLLAEQNAVVKADAVRQLEARLESQSLAIDAQARLIELSIPGRPAKPELVPPLSLPKRSMRTLEGRAALIHALAHIEFNAINLALDAIWRFENMPSDYYKDWLKVAAEEAYHFTLLNEHLQTLGYQYGDFAGHNSLWEMVDRTKNDVLARMALVPRTMEARGLDASPALRNKLAQAGDAKAAAILDIILRDEIGHVAIGNYWYNWLCKQRGLEPLATYDRLANEYQAPKLRAPFNLDARRQAGFSEAELEKLVGVID
jgi:uncharacterized ferritin-like protein (DUF455 family)